MTATAKKQSLGTKPTMLAVVFLLLALFRSSINLLGTVYVVHFPFDVTMEFDDRELSPDPSCLDRSSVDHQCMQNGDSESSSSISECTSTFQ